MFHSMFYLALPVAEKVIRPVLVYFFLVLLLRLFGKRELAQLNPFDLVVVISLSNTVQNAIIGEDTSVSGGLIGAFSLCAVNYLTVRFLFKHRRLDQVIEGSPTVLIEGGELVPQGMARELLTESDLITIAHRQGFSTIDEIERCVLEPGGTFFIQGKKPHGAAKRQLEILERIDRLEHQLQYQVEELKELLRER